ncbi:DNA repair ATPase [Zhouia spongiae]|uniref:DNA repair ATPase n=1 Tax=Zhouia spongiae TaxID=2202721 RepID=A0ABY3YTT0_9FLAO|nr:DNA repair ATPase [Zhouia spongiae]UNZ00009.1 DNA repair ATPase [Zhouia spongiae]
MQEEKTTSDVIQLDGGTYEIIQNRLQKQKEDLQNRLGKLNEARSEVFGGIETKLIANNRINTENNCIACDIVTIGGYCLLGYNVHFGLRTEITMSDVFSIYKYDGNQFVSRSLDFIHDEIFINDFTNLYKYYRNTVFKKFAVMGNYLHMVFQLSESNTDIKTFKWLIKDKKPVYVDNRSEHEYKFPAQYEFNWVEVTRDMQRHGTHAHVAILDKVFVETIGGDLTIKIEDNTDDGKGIYSEPVKHIDQTLDDAQYKYADIGNLLVLEIKPFQESSRYFVYNHKIQEVKKIDSIKDACVLLPDDQGIIFGNGYYLQSGAAKVFDSDITNLKFQEKLSAPNGEDFIYVFYEAKRGLYVLMQYNIIEQEVKTPIACNGFTFLETGELCYFKNENEQTRHHVIQIWQTPFVKAGKTESQYTDTLIYKIGNKDIVKAMAECQGLITLLNKEDSYDGLYDDIAKQSIDVIDSYYWIHEEDTHKLSEPLKEINDAANAAIDEFEKVVQLRKEAFRLTAETEDKSEAVFGKIKSSSFRSIDDFVQVLAQLRTLRGEVISLNEIRYIDTTFTGGIEEQIAEQNDKISKRCVQFLLDEKALLPYHDRVEEKQQELQGINKVIDAKKLEDEVNQIASDLEMLIDIVSNLEIEDASQSTKIIENISHIFATINQLKSGIKNTIQRLGSKEARAEFAAQIKLIDQGIINYLDIADTPEKTEDMLNKVAVQLEELEGRFADFEDFISAVIEKREEVYNAFEARKNSLVEARNKKASALESAAKRILNGVSKKALSFNAVIDINGYFASDLMINKLRDIVQQLLDLDDAGKAETIETALKSAREDAIRKLKDKQDLYEDGENVIKLGKHKFGVNNQQLDLTIVYKSQKLFYHLTGTDFYQEVTNEILTESRSFWDRELVSESEKVYRSEYLAFKIYEACDVKTLSNYTGEEIESIVKTEASKNYAEGYVKGVHDVDAIKILKTLIKKTSDLGLLIYPPRVRAFAQYFWFSLPQNRQVYLNDIIKASGEVLRAFPESKAYRQVVEIIVSEIKQLWTEQLPTIEILDDKDIDPIANYLFKELKDNNSFIVSSEASRIYSDFIKMLKKKDLDVKLVGKIESLATSVEKISLARQWISSFVMTSDVYLESYVYEVICVWLYSNSLEKNIVHASPEEELNDLKGNHSKLNNEGYKFDYHEFIERLSWFKLNEVPAYNAYREAKHKVTDDLKESLKLQEFKPRVLSSFVRNKLIDQVYLPLFGDNLAKQLGSVGQHKRTDRMGMLLLVSPPGYGKTTLMEYLANRLGLVFMKINGPAIGHEVTSVDPMAAKNAAAKEELKKLNLAFEMGNNVMLYVDDIQHCNPEFLQKFISLADGTRKIEGVYNNKPKTYDLRSKKFCVVMAGNPYTESGDKFQIPDMLANRADIYNLGDIIGDTENLFKLSLIENALTSNPVLHQLGNKNFDDLYHFVEMAELGNNESVELKGNYTKQEVRDYLSVIKKVLTIRDRVMQVNVNYIKSAAMDDADRTEPSFKLQGSYRDMNKLVEKVVPIMNDKEIETLLLTHYENESQTLTSAAEANLLKYKEIAGVLNNEEKERWRSIKETFIQNNKLKGLGNKNEMAQVLMQMMQFSEHLAGIQEVLRSGLQKEE